MTDRSDQVPEHVVHFHEESRARRRRAKVLAEERINPFPVTDGVTDQGIITTASSDSGHGDGYIAHIFIDWHLLCSRCLLNLVERDPQLYEDYRHTIHVKVPDPKVHLCFCGFYSHSTASDLEAHLNAHPFTEADVKPLLERAESIGTCGDCLYELNNAAQGKWDQGWAEDDTTSVYDCFKVNKLPAYPVLSVQRPSKAQL